MAPGEVLLLRTRENTRNTSRKCTPSPEEQFYVVESRGIAGYGSVRALSTFHPATVIFRKFSKRRDDSCGRASEPVIPPFPRARSREERATDLDR